jgi:hypothetical protein
MESLFCGFFSLPCRANKETNIIEYHEVNHSWFANSLSVHEVKGLKHYNLIQVFSFLNCWWLGCSPSLS